MKIFQEQIQAGGPLAV
ncbi:MAG: hypothetical protein Q8O90_05760 [Elusimicrobiota bacterium]|nr:hypothetical protein [Elusimicrobiota bacterium]